MAKLRVGVVYGGPSNEHEISISSGKSILQHIDRDKYDIVEVFIDKQGVWRIGDHASVSTNEAISLLKKQVDIVLLGLHGTFGEDGHIQALFDKAGIRYTGSGAAASKLAFDKELSQKAYEANGLPVPAWEIVDSLTADLTVNIPLVVKPPCEGSSVGVGIVKQQSQLEPAIKKALQFGPRAMVQEYIEGVEVSCGVIENPEPTPLTPTELRPVKDDFFSYEAKYEIGGTDELTPPELPDTTIENIKELAVKAHKVLGCRGYSRTDMFVVGEKLFLIETNTLPGFTPTSILPQQAEHDGVSYTKLLNILIEQARHD